MLARGVPAVVEVPQLRALPARVPPAERVAQADDPLLGPRALLVAAAAAEHGVEPVLVDRVEQRDGLQRVARAVRALDQPAVVDPVLDVRDLEAQAQALDEPVAEVDDLRVVVPGVDVQQRERHGRRREGLDGQVHQQRRVLAAGEEDHGAVELARDLAEDVDRLALQGVERVQGSRHACRPHSVLARPAQRPERGSAPGSGFDGAGPAADRRVALVDQRVHQHVVLVDVGLHLLVAPRGERVELHQAVLLVEGDQRGVRPGRRLDPAHAGDPRVVAGQRLAQRDDLAQEAALVGVAGEQVAAQQRVLLGDGVLRQRR